MYKTLLRYVLLTDGVVAGQVASRVFPAGEVPQAVTYPFIVFEETGDVSGCRDCSNADKLRGSAVEVRCYATSYSDAQYLAKAARSALDGYKGTAGHLEETIVGCFVRNPRDTTVRPAAEGESPVHAAVFDATVWHYD